MYCSCTLRLIRCLLTTLKLMFKKKKMKRNLGVAGLDYVFLLRCFFLYQSGIMINISKNKSKTFNRDIVERKWHNSKLDLKLLLELTLKDFNWNIVSVIIFCIFCGFSSKPVKAVCGVSRIWVFSQSRRQKIATRLIDCVRYVYKRMWNLVKLYFQNHHQIYISLVSVVEIVE